MKAIIISSGMRGKTITKMMSEAEMVAIVENPILPMGTHDNVSRPNQELPTVLAVDNVSGMIPKKPELDEAIPKLIKEHDYAGPIKDGRQLRRERRKGERLSKKERDVK